MLSLHLHHTVMLPAIIWFQFMVTEVQEPYMDEEFHVRQTETYLSGKWDEWDPKITTPPGLYLLGVGWKTLAAALPLTKTTDLTIMRSFSLACFIAIVITICKGKTASQRLTELSITTLPIIFFFVPFYYTDITSLLVLLWLRRSVQDVKNAHLYNFVLCITAVLLRQTNIIWVAFIYGESTLIASRIQCISDLLSFKLLGALKHVVVHKMELLVAVSMCIAFVVYNKSIVLGDKSNHQASFHPTQLVYLSCLVAVFFPFSIFDSAVSLISLKNGKQKTSNLNIKALVKAVIAGGFYLVFSWYCLTHYCITHPFTLSDNRHYTFYLWRRLGLMPDSDSGIKFILVPISLMGFYISIHCFSKATTVGVLYFICAAASLVLSPLFEPRYFILPIVFMMLSAIKGNQLSASTSCLHVLLHFIVNAATIYLFLKKSFTAPDGTVGRFMW